MGASGDPLEETTGRKPGSRLAGWCKGTKPTDLLSVLMALLSVAVAALALHKADQVAEQQEEANAPVLAPGTPLGERGEHGWVTTEYARVRKRLDRMLVDRGATAREPTGRLVRVGRMIIPLRNGGAGIALTLGHAVLVQDCDREPRYLPATAVGQLGTYFLPSGGSDQLGYLQRPTDKYGTVTIDDKPYWYSFDYEHFAEIGKGRSTNVVVWYTDGARRLLRWTCITYSFDPSNSKGRQTEWAVDSQVYGTRPMVPLH